MTRPAPRTTPRAIHATRPAAHATLHATDATRPAHHATPHATDVVGSGHRTTPRGPGRRWRPLGAVAVLVLALVGCGGADGGGNERNGGDGASAGEPSGTITVSAAASLTEAFTRIGDDFESAHPGASVTFSFGASSAMPVRTPFAYAGR